MIQGMHYWKQEKMLTANHTQSKFFPLHLQLPLSLAFHTAPNKGCWDLLSCQWHAFMCLPLSFIIMTKLLGFSLLSIPTNGSFIQVLPTHSRRSGSAAGKQSPANRGCYAQIKYLKFSQGFRDQTTGFLKDDIPRKAHGCLVWQKTP